MPRGPDSVRNQALTHAPQRPHLQIYNIIMKSYHSFTEEC